MEIKGVIERMSDITTGLTKNGNNWIKREIIVTEINEKYPQRAKIVAMNKVCDQLDGLGEGSEVIVKFNVQASDYNGNCFNNLNAYSIAKV